MMGEPKGVQPALGRHYDSRSEVDNAVVVHEFENGLGTIDTAGMHIESGKTRRIEVYGTKGTAIHTPIGSDNLSLSLGNGCRRLRGWFARRDHYSVVNLWVAVAGTRRLYSWGKTAGLHTGARYGCAADTVRRLRYNGWERTQISSV